MAEFQVAADEPEASAARREYLAAVRRELAAGAAADDFDRFGASTAVVAGAESDLAVAEAATDAAWEALGRDVAPR